MEWDSRKKTSSPGYTGECEWIIIRIIRDLTGVAVDNLLFVRGFRDMRLLSIGGGADEVMIGVICKLMKTLPTPPKAR